MNEPSQITLTDEAWEEISRHARDTFPEECCGMVLSKDESDMVHRCTNIQNKLHALDSQTYPRDATIAYAMDFKELEMLTQQAEREGTSLKAFYHSHPNHKAYFSDEDKGFASPFGEPTYPQSAQIVISIYGQVVKEICAYAWNSQEKDFIAIPLSKIPSS